VLTTTCFFLGGADIFSFGAGFSASLAAFLAWISACLAA